MGLWTRGGCRFELGSGGAGTFKARGRDGTEYVKAVSHSTNP